MGVFLAKHIERLVGVVTGRLHFYRLKLDYSVQFTEKYRNVFTRFMEKYQNVFAKILQKIRKSYYFLLPPLLFPRFSVTLQVQLSCYGKQQFAHPTFTSCRGHQKRPFCKGNMRH